jgi:hypothetical protein
MSSVRLVKVRDSNLESLTTIEIPIEDFIEIVDSSKSDLVFKGEIRYEKEHIFLYS